MVTPVDRIGRLDKALRDRLGGAGRAWLDEALAEATNHAATEAHPSPTSPATLPTWEMRFASAGRHCLRKEPPHHADPEAAEAARVLILHSARAGGATVARLYGHGTAAERRAVLVALPYLPLGTDALPLVEDALRTNDTRLVAAAVGPYAAQHLDAHAWRHAVLKCLFTGVPVNAVSGLAERSRGDAELARMLGDYARERTSAGRPVPDDLHAVLALTRSATPAGHRAADDAPGHRPADRPGAPRTPHPPHPPHSSSSPSSPEEA